MSPVINPWQIQLRHEKQPVTSVTDIEWHFHFGKLWLPLAIFGKLCVRLFCVRLCPHRTIEKHFCISNRTYPNCFEQQNIFASNRVGIITGGGNPLLIICNRWLTKWVLRIACARSLMKPSVWSEKCLWKTCVEARKWNIKEKTELVFA